MQSETESVRQEYDRLAASYDRRWRDYVDVTLRAVVESTSIQGNERILDIACGTGELERLLLARWPDLQIFGTDISTEMLRRAAGKDENRKASFVRAAASHLPFPDQSFDYAICANSFHYFHSPLKALQEVHRVLRPHGTFVFIDWCDNYLSCKLCGMWLRLTDPAFFRTYTVHASQAMLEKSGFEVMRKDHFRVGWIWGIMRFVCRKST
jgi:ubiquinone/menaquinone biosynthesis C-methylase UbiE